MRIHNSGGNAGNKNKMISNRINSRKYTQYIGYVIIIIKEIIFTTLSHYIFYENNILSTVVRTQNRRCATIPNTNKHTRTIQ